MFYKSDPTKMAHFWVGQLKDSVKTGNALHNSNLEMGDLTSLKYYSEHNFSNLSM